jgi:hypothetical protein
MLRQPRMPHSIPWPDPTLIWKYLPFALNALRILRRRARELGRADRKQQ